MFAKEEQEKIINSEYERAFTELASFLFEQYREQKEVQEAMNDIEQDESCQS